MDLADWCKKMSQTTRLLSILVCVTLAGLSIGSVAADPLTGNVAVGDRYLLTTVRGQAKALVDGHWVIGPANLQLLVQVTYVGPHYVVFKVLSGTFQVNYKPYTVDAGRWRGDYNRDTNVAVYQGPATAPDGRLGYFVLYGRDTQPTQQGVFMNFHSDFLGEYKALWHVELTTFRTQVI